VPQLAWEFLPQLWSRESARSSSTNTGTGNDSGCILAHQRWLGGVYRRHHTWNTVLKITPIRENDTAFRVRLCGQFTKEYVAELERTLAGEDTHKESVALDLTNVTFVDREAMVFLCSAKGKNIAIENCPSYVIRWIQQERLCGGSRTDSK